MTVRLLLNSDQVRSNPHRSKWFEYVLLLAGLLAIDTYIWTNVNTELSQSYDNWALDQQVRGDVPTLGGFIADGFGLKDPAPKSAHATPSKHHAKLPPLALVGRIGIPRLGLSAVVREGVDESVLRSAVGHMPSTALPGDPGNVAIAAHRDTLFRKLRGVRKNDRITMETPDGLTYDYSVDSMKIVNPNDVSVLRPDKNGQSLTLITCYPFNYIGAAPNRYIVRASRISVTAGALTNTPQAN